ncbi:MAG: TlpA family protein disulfide reductase [Polaribacter sp.]
MKKIFLFIAAIAIVSCTTESKIDYAIVSGKILDAKTNKISILNEFNTDTKREIVLDENGVFSDTIYIKDGNNYLLRQDRNGVNLFLEKGDKINITYNAKKLDSTISISGNEINAYLIQKNGLEKVGSKILYSKNEADFLETLSEIKINQQNLLKETDGISESYKTDELKNIDYEYLNSLADYEMAHKYYAKDKDFKASDGFFDPLDKVNLESENDFVFSNNYRRIIASLHSKEAGKMVEKDSLLDRSVAFVQSVSTIKNQKIKNKLLFDDAKFGITFTNNLEDYYAIFSKNSTNATNNAKIEKDYKKLKALASGSPSPKFNGYENNAGGKTSLEDLKGKYVYIDVWATWCGPCIAEIPSLKKVEKDFHNKNIEFVSISIDRMKDHEK